MAHEDSLYPVESDTSLETEVLWHITSHWRNFYQDSEKTPGDEAFYDNVLAIAISELGMDGEAVQRLQGLSKLEAQFPERDI